MVPSENKAKHLLPVNYTTKAIQYHPHDVRPRGYRGRKINHQVRMC